MLERESDVPSYGVTNSISSEPSATRMRALGIVFCDYWKLSVAESRNAC